MPFSTYDRYSELYASGSFPLACDKMAKLNFQANCLSSTSLEVCCMDWIRSIINVLIHGLGFRGKLSKSSAKPLADGFLVRFVSF